MDTGGDSVDRRGTDEPCSGLGTAAPWQDQDGQGYLTQLDWERAIYRHLLGVWRSTQIIALREAHRSGDTWLVSALLTPSPRYACLACLCQRDCAFHPWQLHPEAEDLILEEDELPEVE